MNVFAEDQGQRELTQFTVRFTVRAAHDTLFGSLAGDVGECHEGAVADAEVAVRMQNEDRPRGAHAIEHIRRDLFAADHVRIPTQAHENLIGVDKCGMRPTHEVEHGSKCRTARFRGAIGSAPGVGTHPWKRRQRALLEHVTVRFDEAGNDHLVDEAVVNNWVATRKIGGDIGKGSGMKDPTLENRNGLGERHPRIEGDDAPSAENAGSFAHFPEASSQFCDGAVPWVPKECFLRRVFACMECGAHYRLVVRGTRGDRHGAMGA